MVMLCEDDHALEKFLSASSMRAITVQGALSEWAEMPKTLILLLTKFFFAVSVDIEYSACRK